MRHLLFPLAVFAALSFSCRTPGTTSQETTSPGASAAVNAFPAKMNVLYVGCDNIITVNAGGIPKEKLQLKMDSAKGRLVDSGGYYHLFVPGPGMYTLLVNGNPFSFRAKRMPDPVTCFAGVWKSEAVLKTGDELPFGIVARWQNFDFDAWARIVSFEMSYLEEGQWKTTKANGPGFTIQMRNMLEHRKPGDRFIFGNVQALLSDGTTRQLNGLTLEAK